MWVRGLVVVALLPIGCQKDAPPPVDPDAGTREPAMVPVDEPVIAAAEETGDDGEDQDEDDFDESSSSPGRTEPLRDEGPITFKLHNLCSKAVKYGLAPLEGETELEDAKTIKAGAVEDITANYGIAVHLIEEGKHSAAATERTGGHVWISSSCVGVGASDNPDAVPSKIDRDLRDKIERMRKATEQSGNKSSPPPPKPEEEPEESWEDAEDAD